MRSGGEVRRRVKIQAQTKTIDTESPSWRDAGAMAWTTQKTVQARITQIGSSEFQDGNQRQNEVTMRVRIRYLAYISLTAANRLTYELDGNTYILNIESITLPGLDRRGDWNLLCSQGLNKG